eukprot:scaffold74946_cov54-Phaeocystis_antarctica.AAC.1
MPGSVTPSRRCAGSLDSLLRSAARLAACCFFVRMIGAGPSRGGRRLTLRAHLGPTTSYFGSAGQARGSTTRESSFKPQTRP